MGVGKSTYTKQRRVIKTAQEFYEFDSVRPGLRQISMSIPAYLMVQSALAPRTTEFFEMIWQDKTDEIDLGRIHGYEALSLRIPPAFASFLVTYSFHR